MELVATGLNDVLATSSTNGLVGTRFATQSGDLKTQWLGVRPLHPLLSRSEM